mgnify:CR=1 FL=1
MKLHPDSEIYKVMARAGSAWNNLRSTHKPSGEGDGADVTNLSISSYYNKTPDRERNRGFSIQEELNSSIAPVLYNNYAVSSPDGSRTAEKQIAVSPLKPTPDGVKVFTSPSHTVNPQKPLVRLETSDQRVLSAAVNELMDMLGSPCVDEEEEEQTFSVGSDVPIVAGVDRGVTRTYSMAYNAKQHRVSIAVESNGTAANAAHEESTPVSIPHHTPVVHAPPTVSSANSVGGGMGLLGLSGKFNFRDAPSSSSSAAAASSAGTNGESMKAAVGLNRELAPVPTGSAAVAVATGIYRSQGSFKASNLGIKTKDSPGSNGRASFVSNVSSKLISGTSQGGGDHPTAVVLPRQSFVGSDIKSPYTYTTPSKSRKTVINADILCNSNVHDIKSNVASNVASNTNSGTVILNPDSHHSKMQVSSEHSANKTKILNNKDADCEDEKVLEDGDSSDIRPAEVSAQDVSGDFGSPAALVTPVRQTMRTSGGFDTSTRLTGANTTMKSSLNSTGASLGVGMNTPIRSQPSAPIESKSAVAPRRPSNAPNQNEAARNAMRNSRYGSLQKGKSSTAASMTASTTAASTAGAGTPGAVQQRGGKQGAETPTAVTMTGKKAEMTIPTPTPPLNKEPSSAFKRNSLVKKASQRKQ